MLSWLSLFALASRVVSAQFIYGPNIVNHDSTFASGPKGTIGDFHYNAEFSGDDYPFIEQVVGGPGYQLSDGTLIVSGLADSITFSGVISAIETGRKYIFLFQSSPYVDFAATYYLGGQVIDSGTTFVGGSDDLSKTLSFTLYPNAANPIDTALFSINQVFVDVQGTLVPQRRRAARQLQEQQAHLALHPNCPAPMTACPLSAISDGAYECSECGETR